MPTLVEWIQIAGIVVTLLVALWGFYTGWLPRWLRRQIGFYELRDKVECVEENTSSLKEDHRQTIEEIQTLKAGQVAIAESVANDHDVDAERLRRTHFGDTNQPGDFIGDND